MGATKTSKLLARKRPRLIPVVDSVIRAALPLGDDDSWKSLRSALQGEQVRANIDKIRPPGLAPTVSTLHLRPQRIRRTQVVVGSVPEVEVIPDVGEKLAESGPRLEQPPHGAGLLVD